LYGSGTIMVVSRENHLGIARCEEVDLVGFTSQLFAELEVVVDLPVEQDRVALRSVRRTPAQWLMGVLDIDDGQPVETEHHISVVPGARLVGSAMPLAAQRRGDV